MECVEDLINKTETNDEVCNLSRMNVVPEKEVVRIGTSRS